MASSEAQPLADLILEFARKKQRFEELRAVNLATFAPDELVRYLETYREVEQSTWQAWERLNRARLGAAKPAAAPRKTRSFGAGSTHRRGP